MDDELHEMITTQSCLVGLCLVVVSFLLTVVGIINLIRWVF